MAIVSGHDCSNDRVVSDSNKKEPIVNRDLIINNQTRIVVRRLVTENGFP